VVEATVPPCPTPPVQYRLEDLPTHGPAWEVAGASPFQVTCQGNVVIDYRPGVLRADLAVLTAAFTGETYTGPPL
jgi:hypothetical protein